MGERRCRYCPADLPTLPNSSREQTVCSEADCQRQTPHANITARKIAADPEYRQVCQDSSRKWRARNPGYWKQYREAASQPRRAEPRRSSKPGTRNSRLRDLANNNSALDLKHSAAGFGWSAPAPPILQTTTQLPRKYWIMEALPPRRLPPPSCKQHPSGFAAGPAAIKEQRHMLTTDQINDLHRLYWSERWPHSQDRTPSENELAHDPQISRCAGAGVPGPRTNQQTRSVSRPPSPNGWRKTPASPPP